MLGCVLDVEAVVQAARPVGARILLDACQSVPHMPIDVQALGVDWIVASGHKAMGPTGIGFLWGRCGCRRQARNNTSKALPECTNACIKTN
jgi:cysteine desulfurase / selenocysteine lyase